jgi:DNA-binding response OmpR family regulator
MRSSEGVQADKRILIIGDDARSRSELATALARQELRAWAIRNGPTAALLSYLRQADLVILEVPPSGTDEWALLQQIRGLSTIPVIVLIAANDYRLTVQGLDRGADYVMSQPVSVRELCARVGALLRRAQTTAQRPRDFRRTRVPV